MNRPLSEKIIEEIERRGIVPRPRWQFLLKTWVLWSLASISMLLGAIGVATIIFIFTDYDKSLGKYLTESIFVDVLEVIPYFWLGTLAIIIGLTQYAVRHTPFGYRYSTIRILGVVFAGSLCLGVGLYSLGFGERVQNFLVLSSPYYDELTYTSKDAWTRPDKGLLGGTITAVSGAEEIELTDFQGRRWHVNVEEVDTKYITILRNGILVKVIGTEGAGSLFSAEEMFPWEE